MEYQRKNKDKFILYSLKLYASGEKEFIDKYQLRQAPIPLLLVMAPNEVITGGFPQRVTKDQLDESMSLSDLVISIMKSMQNRKIALVCFQNDSTKFNNESIKAAKDFKSVPGYESIVDIIITAQFHPTWLAGYAWLAIATGMSITNIVKGEMANENCLFTTQLKSRRGQQVTSHVGQRFGGKRA